MLFAGKSLGVWNYKLFEDAFRRFLLGFFFEVIIDRQGSLVFDEPTTAVVCFIAS
jgi:hypothetical protein